MADFWTLQKPSKRPRGREPYQLRTVGKTGRRWLGVRRQWIRDNPPAHDGTYVCGICGSKVTAAQMQLDHIKKRGSHPELRFDITNLRPTHAVCNYGRN